MFGATDLLQEETADISNYAPVVILRLRNMTAIDGTGLHALQVLCDRLKRSGRTLILCGARRQPAKFLRQAAFVRRIGKDNIQPDVEAALAHAREIYQSACSIAQL
jgi:SulP family sulfate permease